MQIREEKRKGQLFVENVLKKSKVFLALRTKHNVSKIYYLIHTVNFYRQKVASQIFIFMILLPCPTEMRIVTIVVE